MLVRTVPVLDGDPSAVVRRATTPGRTSAPVEADDDDRGLAVFAGPPPVVEEGIPGTVTGDGVDLSVETTAEAAGRPPREVDPPSPCGRSVVTASVTVTVDPDCLDVGRRRDGPAGSDTTRLPTGHRSLRQSSRSPK